MDKCQRIMVKFPWGIVVVDFESLPQILLERTSDPMLRIRYAVELMLIQAALREYLSRGESNDGSEKLS